METIAGMLEVHDEDGGGELLGGETPDPDGTVSKTGPTREDVLRTGRNERP